MSKNQERKCKKGLHTYKQRIVKDLGGTRHLLLNCIYCNHEYKKPHKNNGTT